MGTFNFKYFSITQSRSALKVGTDAMVLGALVQGDMVKRVLDVGSGTGILSLMLAQKFPNVRVCAIEIDKGSLTDCKENFANSPWSDRLELIHCDILNYSPDSKFDLIVTNPPFYRNSLQNPDERKAASRHANFLPFDLLLDKISELLNHNGACWMIIPSSEREYVVKLANSKGLFLAIDYSVNGKPNAPIRNIICFTREFPDNPFHKSITIRDNGGEYSSEYKELTREFHDREL